MLFAWLIIIILAYFFFSLSSLGDKLILSGKPEPRSYTFFVAIASAFVVFIIPFIEFGFPTQKALFWIIAEAIVYISGLYAAFSALEKFDVSKVAATIGATQPIFIFILTWIFFGYQAMCAGDIVAFILLIIGGFLVSLGKNVNSTENYLKITLLSSLLFSFDYIFSKIIFLNQPFLQGLIWMRIFVFLFALMFLIGKKNRKEIFEKQNILNKKTGTIFLGTQALGGVGGILQSFAISLSPIAFLPILNSLRGIQYALLFLMTLFLSMFFPKILKEEISKKIIIQKIISIILIAAGLAILIL